MLPLHPKLVHLPMALAALMPLVLLGLGLALRRQWLPARAWIVGVALQGVLLAGGLAARWSGERDEPRVEGRVPEAALEGHERAATVFLVGAGGVLLLAAGAAALRRPRAAEALRMAAFLGSLGVLGLGVRVGEAGGRLVYGPGGAASPAQAQPAAGAEEHHERERD